MRDSARFWDKRADKYSKRPVKDMEIYEKTRALPDNAKGSADDAPFGRDADGTPKAPFGCTRLGVLNIRPS